MHEDERVATSMAVGDNDASIVREYNSRPKNRKINKNQHKKTEKNITTLQHAENAKNTDNMISCLANAEKRKKDKPIKMCGICYKTLRTSTVKCFKCSSKFHSNCLKKTNKMAGCIYDLFLCNSCNVCTECPVENDDSMVRCKACPRIFHRRCTNAPFCKSCRTYWYMNMNIKTAVNFELNMFNSIIKNKGFLMEAGQKSCIIKETIIQKLFIGNKSVSPKYFSPFINISETIYICEKCLSYYKEMLSLERHKAKCDGTHYGNLVYSSEIFKLYEVDGEFDTLFCRNLCLIAKCFLDHKTLYYDVESFLFYTLYNADDNLIGYFSRDKFSPKYNLSCIVVLPCYQGRGFGYFLIDFSYELFKLMKRKGTPEKPLSEQGLAVYKKYWKYKVYNYLIAITGSTNISKIASSLAMTDSDVVYALEQLNFLVKMDGRYRINVTKMVFNELYTCDFNSIIVNNMRFLK